MKLLFLDESGDHSLDKIDPQYPIFVLGGVIVDQEYAETEMAEKIRAFKCRLFGHENIILHTTDITRNKNGFERMKDAKFRDFFYEELNRLMRKLEYKVVACVIDKTAYAAGNPIGGSDAYSLAFRHLVELFCFEIGPIKFGGSIIAERRNDTLDTQLDLSWQQINTQGTPQMQAAHIARRITGFSLHNKKARILGLELADLVVTPIGRHVQGKASKEDFDIINSKFRRDTDGTHHGYGLIIIPPQNRYGQDPLRSSRPMV